MDDVRLSTQETADLADVSRPLIAKLCDQRKLTFRQIGNRRRVLESSLRSWLAANPFASGSGEHPPQQSDELPHDEPPDHEHADRDDAEDDPAAVRGQVSNHSPSSHRLA